MAVAIPSPIRAVPNPPTPLAVQERLEHWREVLLQVQSGKDRKTTLGTCWLALDRWLDEMVDRPGYKPLPDVWDRVWPATWDRARMSKEA